MDITQTIGTHVSRISSAMNEIGRVRPYNLDHVMHGLMTAVGEISQALTKLAAEVQRLETIEKGN
jgi:hypothetical protein